jgi:hypothetical protein
MLLLLLLLLFLLLLSPVHVHGLQTVSTDGPHGPAEIFKANIPPPPSPIFDAGSVFPPPLRWVSVTDAHPTVFAVIQAWTRGLGHIGPVNTWAILAGGGECCLRRRGRRSLVWLMLMLSLCPIAAFLHGFLFAGERGSLTCLEGGIHKAHEEVTRGNLEGGFFYRSTLYKLLFNAT